MFRSSKLVYVSLLVGVLTAGLAEGAAPAAAQEERQLQRPTGRFSIPWNPDRPVPPYVPEDFLRNAQQLGLTPDVDHTITVRLGTTTLTLAPAAGAAAQGSQSIGLLQVDAPDNAGLSGAYQLRLVTPPPNRALRTARTTAPPASALQLVRPDGSVLAGTQVTDAAAYQRLAAQTTPAAASPDSMVWRDANPQETARERKWSWKDFFEFVVDVVTILAPLIL